MVRRARLGEQRRSGRALGRRRDGGGAETRDLVAMAAEASVETREGDRELLAIEEVNQGAWLDILIFVDGRVKKKLLKWVPPIASQ